DGAFTRESKGALLCPVDGIPETSQPRLHVEHRVTARPTAQHHHRAIVTGFEADREGRRYACPTWPFCAAGRWPSNSRTIASLPRAPTTRAFSSPPWNMIRVGMLMTP